MTARPYAFGRVLDSSRTPIPGAVVTVTGGTGTFDEVAAISNEAGSYRTGAMEPGSYTLQASHEQRGRATREVQVSRTPVEVDFILEPST